VFLSRRHEDHMKLWSRLWNSGSSKGPFDPTLRRRLIVAGLASAAIVARPARAAAPTTADCLAATESSLALRKEDQLRAARAQLLICSAASCPADVRDECTRRAAEVKAAIPTMVFAAKDAAANDLVVVRVMMDGQLIADRLEGTPLLVDPGAHTFSFETLGQPKTEKRFVIREGEKDRRELIVFGATAASAVALSPFASSPAAPATHSIAPQSDGPQSASGHWGTRKKVGLAFGAAGMAGLATGVIFSLAYDSRAADFNEAGCFTSEPANGPPGCQSRRDNVTSAEGLLVFGYVSAAVLGGIGAYLFLTATPSEIGPGVALGARSFPVRCLPSGSAGIACGGRF
jgi:hypothetical protein